VIPLHFLYHYYLHSLSENPLFWLLFLELERTQWMRSRRPVDGWAGAVLPAVQRATPLTLRRPRGRRLPVRIGKGPILRRRLPPTPAQSVADRQPVSWLPARAGEPSHSARVVYHGRLSGPDLWLRYGFDGWQDPVNEVELESSRFGMVTCESIALDGHITLDCVVTDGWRWDNNSGADYRLWIGFDPLDSHLHVSGQGSGDLGLASLQTAMVSAGMRRGIVSWVDNEALDRINWSTTGLFPLVWVRPGETPREGVWDRLAAGFVGLKLHPTVDDYRADDAALDPYLEIAAEVGCPVACHSAPGDADPDHIRRLAERFPMVPVILYHTYLGPSEGRWRAARHVHEQPNLYLETSWCRWRTVVQLVEEVGPGRVLFGSDASVDGPHHYCRHPPNVEGHETYNQSLVSLVRALGPPSARRVLGDNARRLFGLSGAFRR
jgi:hypothetical protein